MNNETKIQRVIMLAISQAGHTVWRNNTGRFWEGRQIHRDGKTVTLGNANMIAVGLCVGSADLIGIHNPSGRFFAIEVKTANGLIMPEQQRFIDHVLSCGGIAGICRSEAEALALLSGGR